MELLRSEDTLVDRFILRQLGENALRYFIIGVPGIDELIAHLVTGLSRIIRKNVRVDIGRLEGRSDMHPGLAFGRNLTKAFKVRISRNIHGIGNIKGNDCVRIPVVCRIDSLKIGIRKGKQECHRVFRCIIRLAVVIGCSKTTGIGFVGNLVSTPELFYFAERGSTFVFRDVVKINHSACREGYVKQHTADYILPISVRVKILQRSTGNGIFKVPFCPAEQFTCRNGAGNASCVGTVLRRLSVRCRHCIIHGNIVCRIRLIVIEPAYAYRFLSRLRSHGLHQSPARYRRRRGIAHRAADSDGRPAFQLENNAAVILSVDLPGNRQISGDIPQHIPSAVLYIPVDTNPADGNLHGFRRAHRHTIRFKAHGICQKVLIDPVKIILINSFCVRCIPQRQQNLTGNIQFVHRSDPDPGVFRQNPGRRDNRHRGAIRSLSC